MLGSISPVGEASRRQRWGITATAYTLASVVAGAMVGAALGGLGQLVAAAVAVPLSGRLLAFAVAAVVGALFDAKIIKRPLPTWHRQVDERWLTTYRGWVYGAGFGFQLGCGVVTIVPSAVTYAVLVAEVLTASWLHGLIIGGAFGLVRSVPLLLAGRLRTPAALYEVIRRVTESEPLAHRAAIAGQVVVALVAASVGTTLL